MNHINETVQEYFELKAEAKKIEERLSELKPIIEMHVKVTTGSFTAESTAAVTLQVGEYGINLSGGRRENFATKLALSQLGDLIKPFISTTWFSVLKVTKVVKQSDVA